MIYCAGIPTVYEGDLDDEDSLLKWLEQQTKSDEIEDITDEMMDLILEKMPYVAVLFCKPHVLPITSPKQRKTVDKTIPCHFYAHLHPCIILLLRFLTISFCSHSIITYLLSIHLLFCAIVCACICFSTSPIFCYGYIFELSQSCMCLNYVEFSSTNKNAIIVIIISNHRHHQPYQQQEKQQINRYSLHS